MFGYNFFFLLDLLSIKISCLLLKDLERMRFNDGVNYYIFECFKNFC